MAPTTKPRVASHCTRAVPLVSDGSCGFIGQSLLRRCCAIGVSVRFDKPSSPSRFGSTRLISFQDRQRPPGFVDGVGGHRSSEARSCRPEGGKRPSEDTTWIGR